MKKQYFHSCVHTDIIYNSIIVINNYVVVKRRAIIDYQLRIFYTADKDCICLAISVDIFSSHKPTISCFLYQYNSIIIMFMILYVGRMTYLKFALIQIKNSSQEVLFLFLYYFPNVVIKCRYSLFFLLR